MASHSSQRSAAQFIAPFLLLGSMVTIAGLYMNAQYPDLIVEMRYKFGLQTRNLPAANDSNAEADRLRRINNLVISARNKIDLREGRPFWGAAVHMVELAFGLPSDDVSIHRDGQRIYEFHRYGFSGHREPVVMEFLDNVLICVHYPQRQQTICSSGTTSYYDGEPFPFNYRVQVGG